MKRSTFIRGAAVCAALTTSSLAVPAHAFTCNLSQGGSSAPWYELKFQRVLENSVSLQLPSTTTCLENWHMVRSYWDDNWRSINGIMTFQFLNGVSGNRNELAGFAFAGNSVGKRFTGRLRVSRAAGYSTGFSVAQVFSTGLAPILRLEVMDSRLGLTNHVWAFYRPQEGTGVTAEVKDLGPAPTSAFQDLVIEYNVDGTITAQLGSNPKQSFSTNFAYWTEPGKTTYFKAGCYLQDAGHCKVEYSSLYFDR